MGEKRPSIFPKVFAVMKQHPNIAMTSGEVANEVNIKYNTSFSSDQVADCLSNNMRNHPEMGIKRHAKGIYYWTGEQDNSSGIKAGDEEIFSVIEVFSDGKLMLRDSNERLYAAKPIDDIWG